MSMSNNIENLPEEILTDILTRLPVNQLIESKIVCKSWLTLITSYDFAELHLSHSNHSPCPEDRTLVFFSKRDLYSITLGSNRADKLNFEGHLNLARILGSCRGWLLCANLYRSCSNEVSRLGLVLVNLSTFQYKKLPTEKSRLSDGYWWYGDGFGFGYDNKTDDFKVVFLPCTSQFSNHWKDIMVYSLKANSWKKKSTDGCDILRRAYRCSKAGVLLNNNLLHWYSQSYVFGFDVSTEKWTDVPLPINPLCDTPRLRESTAKPIQVTQLVVQNGCMCITARMLSGGVGDCASYSAEYVWVMKEYGVRESWVKLINIIQLYASNNFLWEMALAPTSYRDGGDKDDVWLMKTSPDGKMIMWCGIREKITRIPCIDNLPVDQSYLLFIACTRSLVTLPRT